MRPVRSQPPKRAVGFSTPYYLFPIPCFSTPAQPEETEDTMRFKLEIELGSDAMQSYPAVLNAIRESFDSIMPFHEKNQTRIDEDQTGVIRNGNGSAVGSWEIVAAEGSAPWQPPEGTTPPACPKCNGHTIAIQADAYASYALAGFTLDGFPVADWDTPQMQIFDDRAYICSGCGFKTADADDFYRAPHPVQ